MLLEIEHLTLYRYAKPVEFSTHRLLLRPLEGHDVQIRASSLRLEPAYRIRWIHDVFDNSIAVVDFLEPSKHLRIESRLTVEQYNTNPFDFLLDPSVAEVPFRYETGILPDVAPYLQRQYPEDDAALQNWIRPFLGVDGRAKTLDFFIALNRSVPFYFSYSRREQPGLQSPAETLRSRSGSCRDFTILLMEAARHFGLAARFVSGYLCRTSIVPKEVAASGATHAWAELFLPGAGWKGFDPTCGILAADAHVRVGVGREPAQVAPVTGSFIGHASAFLDLTVEVRARVAEESQAPADPGELSPAVPPPAE